MITLSYVWGIISGLLMVIGFIPMLGALNWINIPFSGIGMLFCFVAVITSANKQKTGAIAGILICGFAMLFGIVRLIIGGFIF